VIDGRRREPDDNQSALLSPIAAIRAIHIRRNKNQELGMSGMGLVVEAGEQVRALTDDLQRRVKA
jgi:hypothetical protein